MSFPATRMRRLRSNPALRALLQETQVSPQKLVVPLFIREGISGAKPIRSMPGQYQFALDRVLKEIDTLQSLQLTNVLLFGIPHHKDAFGTQAWAEDGIIQQTISAIKKRFPKMFVISDLCFCEYTTHGHCGVLNSTDVENDATLLNLAKTAVAQAQAGADMIAPSGMMDGMIGTIRKALDFHGYKTLPILSYAAKYASAFYGPFRDAAQSTPQFGDRKSYQMDSSNSQEALREVSLDLEEGADIVMVKPALAYLDVIRQIKDRFMVPAAAYNVSGEYAMVKAAAAKGWVDERRIVEEILTGITRAGADWIITYHAKDWATWHRHR